MAHQSSEHSSYVQPSHKADTQDIAQGAMTIAEAPAFVGEDDDSPTSSTLDAPQTTTQGRQSNKSRSKRQPPKALERGRKRKNAPTESLAQHVDVSQSAHGLNQNLGNPSTRSKNDRQQSNNRPKRNEGGSNTKASKPKAGDPNAEHTVPSSAGSLSSPVEVRSSTSGETPNSSGESLESSEEHLETSEDGVDEYHPNAKKRKASNTQTSRKKPQLQLNGPQSLGKAGKAVTSQHNAGHGADNTKRAGARAPQGALRITKAAEASVSGSQLPAIPCPPNSLGHMDDVEEFLSNDPGLLQPNPRKIRKLRDELGEFVTSMTRNLTRSRRVAEQGAQPNLRDLVTDKKFLSLCQPIFGEYNPESIYKEASSIDLTTYRLLVALWGVAIQKGVWEQTPCCMEEMSVQSDFVQRYMKKANQVYPTVHQRLLQWTKSTYIEENVDFSTQAANLSLDFCFDVGSFLTTNGIMPKNNGFNKWRKQCDQVFIAALQIKAQMKLDETMRTFRPHKEEVVNLKYMRIVGNLSGDGENNKVRLTILPGLLRVIKDDSNEDEDVDDVIFPASVYT